MKIISEGIGEIPISEMPEGKLCVITHWGKHDCYVGMIIQRWGNHLIAVGRTYTWNSFFPIQEDVSHRLGYRVRVLPAGTKLEV